MIIAHAVTNSRKLISENKLQSADDFLFSSLIFQHSDAANDLILAHILSNTAVAKGKASACWMAASRTWASARP